MAQREISPTEVEQALASIVSTEPGDRPSRVIKIGTTESGKRLRVVQNTFEPQHIITATRVEKH